MLKIVYYSKSRKKVDLIEEKIRRLSKKHQAKILTCIEYVARNFGRIDCGLP